MRSLVWLAGLALACWPATARSVFVIVAGLGGEPDYEQRFAGWARDLKEVLERPARAGELEVISLQGSQATREQLRRTFEQLATHLGPEDDFALLLIGHGTFDGYEYKMNLPGPDITAEGLRELLDRIPASRQLVVNMTSSSGASLPVLRRPGRIVITATKSGMERNAVVFTRYWIAALRDPAADADKNEVITALEAFRYAQRRTEEFYKSQQRLATEHSILEDTGQGEGARDPSPENGQGLLAARFTLVRLGQGRVAVAAEGRRELWEKKERLEQEIDRLKYQKAALPEEEYKQKLAALLLELAKTQQALEEGR